MTPYVKGLFDALSATVPNSAGIVDLIRAEFNTVSNNLKDAFMDNDILEQRVRELQEKAESQNKTSQMKIQELEGKLKIVQDALDRELKTGMGSHPADSERVYVSVTVRPRDKSGLQEAIWEFREIVGATDEEAKRAFAPSESLNLCFANATAFERLKKTIQYSRHLGFFSFKNWPTGVAGNFKKVE